MLFPALSAAAGGNGEFRASSDEGGQIPGTSNAPRHRRGEICLSAAARAGKYLGRSSEPRRLHSCGRREPELWWFYSVWFTETMKDHHAASERRKLSWAGNNLARYLFQTLLIFFLFLQMISLFVLIWLRRVLLPAVLHAFNSLLQFKTHFITLCLTTSYPAFVRLHLLHTLNFQDQQQR